MINESKFQWNHTYFLKIIWNIRYVSTFLILLDNLYNIINKYIEIQ